MIDSNSHALIDMTAHIQSVKIHTETMWNIPKCKHVNEDKTPKIQQSKKLHHFLCYKTDMQGC